MYAYLWGFEFCFIRNHEKKHTCHPNHDVTVGLGLDQLVYCVTQHCTPFGGSLSQRSLQHGRSIKGIVRNVVDITLPSCTNFDAVGETESARRLNKDDGNDGLTRGR